MNDKITLQLKLIVSSLVFFSGFDNLSVLAQSSNSSAKPSRPSTAEIQNAKNNLRQRVQSLKNGASSHYVKDKRNQKQIQDRNKLVDSWKQAEPELAPFIGAWSGYESSWNIYPSSTKNKVCLVQRDEEGNSTIDIGTVIDSNIYTEKGKIFFKEGNYLGVGKINNGQFIQINNMPLSSPTVLQEPVALKNINGFSPSVKVLKPYVDTNCTASSPGKNSYERTAIENLSDGDYEYGQLPFKGIIGSNYITFRKLGNTFVGMSYYGHSGGFSCLHGTIKGDSLINTTSITTPMGEPGAKDSVVKNKLLPLGEYYFIRNGNFTESIDTCNEKVFNVIPQKQFATVSSRHKKASPDVETPNHVEYGEYKFVKGRSGFYTLHQKQDNKCLWVNTRKKLTAFPCVSYDFEKWNLIPLNIEDNGRVLYAVNVRGTLQCLARGGAIISCNDWKNLLVYHFNLPEK